jgi:hypothetical protein
MRNHCTAGLMSSTLEKLERRIGQRRDCDPSADSAAGMAGAAQAAP